jgi:hypothetical protein
VLLLYEGGRIEQNNRAQRVLLCERRVMINDLQAFASKVIVCACRQTMRAAAAGEVERRRHERVSMSSSPSSPASAALMHASKSCAESLVLVALGAAWCVAEVREMRLVIVDAAQTIGGGSGLLGGTGGRHIHQFVCHRSSHLLWPALAET